MTILLCAATRLEIAPTLDWLQQTYESLQPDHYQKDGQEVRVLITGVGLPLTAFALGHALAGDGYDLALQAGIAGAIDRQLPLGEAVLVTEDRFADLGVEEADGRFTSVFALELIAADQFPFQDGKLLNPLPKEPGFLPTVRGISVNRVHGYAPSISQLREQYPHAQVESMEGAAFFYACLLRQQPCLQIRTISNYVESRNRSNWQIGQAVQQLHTVVQGMLEVDSR